MAEKENQPKEKKSKLEITLEAFSGVVATNRIKLKPNEYGEKAYGFANSIYDVIMGSKNIGEMREQNYQASKAEYQRLGVAGEPTYLSNPELSRLILKQVEENMSSVKIGELYNAVKKFAPKLDIKIDDKIKNMSFNSLIDIIRERKAITKEGKLDLKKLSKEEQVAYSMYELISESYKEATVFNLMADAFYQSANETGKNLNKILQPEEKKESKAVKVNPEEEDEELRIAA